MEIIFREDCLKELYEEGKFQEISNKWFGEDVATDEIKK